MAAPGWWPPGGLDLAAGGQPAENPAPQQQPAGGADILALAAGVSDAGRPRSAPVCQVCGVSLADAKVYLQRYRICNFHRTRNVMMRDGIAQRFCQQCGKFEPVGEFDGDKRTCVKKLARHNQRRRVNRVARLAPGARAAAGGGRHSGGASSDADAGDCGGGGGCEAGSALLDGALLGGALYGSAAAAWAPPPPAEPHSAALQAALDVLSGRARPRPAFQSHRDRQELRLADAGVGADAATLETLLAGGPAAPGGAAPHVPLASLLGDAGAVAAVAAAGGSLRGALSAALAPRSGLHPALRRGCAVVQHGDDVAAVDGGDVRQVVRMAGAAAAAPALAAAEPRARAARFADADVPLVFTLRGTGVCVAGTRVVCRHRGAFPAVEVLGSGHADGRDWVQLCVTPAAGSLCAAGGGALLEFEARRGAYVSCSVPALVLPPGEEEAAAELGALAEGLPRADADALVRAAGEGLRFAAAAAAAAPLPAAVRAAAAAGARAVAVAAAAAGAGALLRALLPAAALDAEAPPAVAVAATAAALDALCPPGVGLMHVAAAAGGGRAVAALGGWARAAAGAAHVTRAWAPDAAGAEGVTPLHLAALARDPGAVRALLEVAGSPPAFQAAWLSARTSDGASPGDYEALAKGLLVRAAAMQAPPPPRAAPLAPAPLLLRAAPAAQHSNGWPSRQSHSVATESPASSGAGAAAVAAPGEAPVSSTGQTLLALRGAAHDGGASPAPARRGAFAAFGDGSRSVRLSAEPAPHEEAMRLSAGAAAAASAASRDAVLAARRAMLGLDPAPPAGATPGSTPRGSFDAGPGLRLSLGSGPDANLQARAGTPRADLASGLAVRLTLASSDDLSTLAGGPPAPA